LLIVLLLLLAAAPYIAARNPFRNWLLGAALSQLNGTVTTSGATFDWFQPIALYDLEIHTPDGTRLLHVPACSGDVPLWRLLVKPTNLGVFRIERPQIEIVLREGGSNLRDLLARIDQEQDPTADDEADRVAGGATFGVDLIDGVLLVRHHDSPRAWDARNIQLSARVERAQTGHERELIVAPGRVLDRIAITPEVCDDLLKYVAPTLAQVTRAGGEFSFDIDRCRVPLDRPRDAEVAGRLTLHDLNAGPGPMVEQVATMFGVPDANQLAREQIVSFEVKDERAFHRDLTFAVGPMGIGTQGFVGFDQSLELKLAVRLPEFANRTAPLRGALSGETLTLPIGGTLARPQLDRRVLTDSGMGVLSGVLDSLLRGQPVSADAIQQGLRDGRILGGEAIAGQAADDGDPANPPAAGALPSLPILEEILRQRAALAEQRRQDAASGDRASPQTGDSPPPPGDRPLRRRARGLLEALTTPPAAKAAPPASAPEREEPPEI
jgi:hypothetical protein